MIAIKQGVERVRKIKETAFGKYLLSIPRASALEHLRQCLVEEPGTNMAWALLDASGAQIDATAPFNVVEDMMKALENA